MKFTLSWLKDHLDTNATLEEITAQLTALGLEVDSVEDKAKLYAPFTVAYVEKAEKHPDADRLKVCTVDTGKDKVNVVCGAPNARAGMKVIFAPEGSYIPGLDTVLKKGVIRGQESCGMMVSEREMGLSDEHEGIIEVAEDAAIGTPFAALYGMDDPVIDIDLTPDRADCAGVRGIARDLAAAGLGTLKPLDESKAAGGFKSPVDVKINKGAEEACPLFIGRMIKNVKNGPSPAWLQNRLKAIGLRPISALVDITNYLSYDLCRPLHVFDADKLKGDIHIRFAQKGETLEALNDKIYELDDFMTAVCDESGVLALGGVIGGIESGCTEETTNVFLEVAYFDPARTAKTGRALQIISDARYRFERGIDPAFTVPATDIATRLIVALCGGEVSEVVPAGKVPDWRREIAYTPALVQKLAGFDVAEKEQQRILETLGCEIKVSGGQWTVTPPSWRGDIEGKADLVEEVIRVHGYDHIPALSLPKETAVTRPAETLLTASIRKARMALASRGMEECVTWSFMNRDLASRFGANDNAALTLKNPINSELDRMRPSILPNLIEAAGRNTDRGHPFAALFEVGPVFETPKPDGQRWVAAGIRCEAMGPRHWSGGEASRAVDAYDAKADALAALAICGGPTANLQTTRDAPSYYHPGRSGALRLGKNVLAYFGEIHPGLLEELDIKGPVCAFEVFLENIPAPKKKGGAARPLLELAALQPVQRDFAFIVDQDTAAEDLIRAVRGVDKKLVADVTIFDVYSGKGVEDGKKSIALNVTLQPQEQTLTDKDLEQVSEKIIGNVENKTGGKLRA